MTTRSWIRAELKRNLDKANRAGQVAAKTEPRAVEAKYLPASHHLRVLLANGASLSLPVGVIPELRAATRAQVSDIEILPGGDGSALGVARRHDQCAGAGRVPVWLGHLDVGTRPIGRNPIHDSQGGGCATQWVAWRTATTVVIQSFRLGCLGPFSRKQISATPPKGARNPSRRATPRPARAQRAHSSTRPPRRTSHDRRAGPPRCRSAARSESCAETNSAQTLQVDLAAQQIALAGVAGASASTRLCARSRGYRDHGMK